MMAGFAGDIVAIKEAPASASHLEKDNIPRKQESALVDDAIMPSHMCSTVIRITTSSW